MDVKTTFLNGITKEEEEDSDEEENKVTDQSSVTIVGYLGTIREISYNAPVLTPLH